MLILVSILALASAIFAATIVTTGTSATCTETGANRKGRNEKKK